MPTKRTPDPARQLREALAPYVDLRQLRTIAATGGELQQALHRTGPDAVPDEVNVLITVLSALLRPARRESIRSPQDVAAMLMVEMGALEQEELRVVVLDTKNRVVEVVLVSRHDQFFGGACRGSL